MVSSFVRPSTRPDEIHSLLTGVERYNPQKTTILEDYLARQCANADPLTNHDLMANLSLLKMYQFNPDMVDVDVVRRILAKALISPSTADFNLCLYLLSDEICSDASISKLLTLRDSLERAQFTKFWKEMYGDDDDEESVVDGIAGFENGLRKLIIGNITSTYQTIPAKAVEEMVNLDQDAENGWAVDNGVISLPLKSENKAVATVIKENVKFEQLTKMLSAANDI
ncbi:ARM repeat-containing protein [Linderina pennispora]|uniref:Eukaryotic translation initiation factor 3 subunit K n=1 Tax=Linderina pennispora TaxID=61395 RepID=A0A1Y1VVP2_9FUNG|nr:ARM repeat-containing protein [Linderina pennispora]ORX65085.1 ARM repeat-containing protein [Linderina pennispora]